MEEVLKGLQGKTLTKKQLFDFLSDINLEELCGVKISNTVQLPENDNDDDNPIKCLACSRTFTVETSLNRHYRRKPECVKFIETLDKSVVALHKEKIKKKRIKVKTNDIICTACSKTFTVENSLKRHYKRNPECVKWNEIYSKTNNIKPVILKKGLHRIINELLEKAICGENNLKCMWCDSEFTNNGLLNKHLNTSTVCNRMSYHEFKRLLEEL